MFTDDQMDLIRRAVVRAASGYMDHPDAALVARDVTRLLVSRETSGLIWCHAHEQHCGAEAHVSRETSAPDMADEAWSGYPVVASAPATIEHGDGPFVGGVPAVGLPTDARALADRQQTGCLLRRGELCPCPAGAYAYDGCERIKAVG